MKGCLMLNYHMSILGVRCLCYAHNHQRLRANLETVASNAFLLGARMERTVGEFMIWRLEHLGKPGCCFL